MEILVEVFLVLVLVGSSISAGNRFSVSNTGVFEAYTSGGGYIKMGRDTDHPSVSGLNAYGGINMHNNSIGACSQIGVDTIGSSSTGKVTVNTALHVQGGLYYIDWNGNEHNAAGLYAALEGGITKTVWLEVGTNPGTAWKEFVFRAGVLKEVN